MPRKRSKTQEPARVRCAIYTRKSTEEGLEKEFNSLDAQRESGEAFIEAQRHEGWECLPDQYDDGGFTGGNMERPALRRLLADIEAGRIDCVVVYKVDRLSRSLMDFSRLMETFERHGVAFVSVTQQFNTTHSMGRLTLNILLSFAQFERELISERVRDKIAASRRKGKWSGGMPLLGYTVEKSKLVVDPVEAERVRHIFQLYLDLQSLLPAVTEMNRRGWTTKRWTTKKGTQRGGRPFTKNALYSLLTNVTYIGQLRYKDEIHDGEHEAIVPSDLFQRVQTLLRRNGHTGGRAVRNRYGALLKGLLHCEPCGRGMAHSFTAKGNRRYRYYVCGMAQQRGWANCPSPSVPAGEIERFVVDQIRCIGSDPALISAVVKNIDEHTGTQTRQLKNERLGLQRQLRQQSEDLLRVANLGERTERAAQLADLQERVQRTERRLAEIDSELMSLGREQISETEVVDALREFDQLWNVLAPREQARLLELLIEQIQYDGENGRVSITFHPCGLRSLTDGFTTPRKASAS